MLSHVRGSVYACSRRIITHDRWMIDDSEVNKCAPRVVVEGCGDFIRGGRDTMIGSFEADDVPPVCVGSGQPQGKIHSLQEVSEIRTWRGVRWKGES